MKIVSKFLLLLAIACLSVGANAKVKEEQRQKKVSHIVGDIGPETAQRYFEETKATLDLPGNRVIYITSLGGSLSAGQNIIDMMEAEKAHGVKLVCVVTEEATSMAFNILTHCDQRYASPSARFLVHKAALGEWPAGLRPTAKNLRTVANELSREDEQYRQANAKAMHLTLAEYDENADQERTWDASELIKMGYLNGYIPR